MAGRRDYQGDMGRPRTLPFGMLPLGMNRKRAAEYLGVSLITFDQMDRGGHLPRPKMAGRVALWPRVALDEVQVPRKLVARDPKRDARFDQIARAVKYAAPGLVYVIAIPGFIKIGFTSREVSKRMANIQTSSPHRIELLATMPGTRALETALHLQFADLSAHGEWFRREGEIEAWIAGGCQI